MKTVDTLAEFNVLWDQLRATVRVDFTVPGRVFMATNWYCRFCSFDLCFSPDLLQSCAQASRASNDDEFAFIMLDPDPIQYYFREFGNFGALTIRAEDGMDDVWKAFEQVPDNSPADALMYAVRRFAVVGPSGEWAVWGSRDEELIICGAQNGKVIEAFGSENCDTISLDEALDSFLQGSNLGPLLRRNYLPTEGKSGT